MNLALNDFKSPEHVHDCHDFGFASVHYEPVPQTRNMTFQPKQLVLTVVMFFHHNSDDSYRS